MNSFEIKLRPQLFYVLLAFTFACSGEKEEKKELLRPVMYEKVIPGGAQKEREFSGTAISGTETKLSFKVSGTISRLNVKVGQEINAGNLIATLDDSDLRLQYEQQDAAVKNADALEKQAKSNYERVRSLYENGNASISEFESAKAQYESAKASESSAKKARKLAKAQISYTELRSPVSGKIATVNAEINENVQAGQQIVMLSSEGDLEVNLGIPETFISLINVRDQVKVRFASIPDQEYVGIVSEVSFSINTQTSTYPVVIKIKGNTSAIRPGMAANAKFNFSTENASDKLIVSAKAVGEDQNGNFVFVLEAQDDHYLAKKRALNVGSLTPEGFEVVDGIEEGELIATAGLQTLLDGMKVKLFEN